MSKILQNPLKFQKILKKIHFFDGDIQERMSCNRKTSFVTIV